MGSRGIDQRSLRGGKCVWAGHDSGLRLAALHQCPLRQLANRVFTSPCQHHPYCVGKT